MGVYFHDLGLGSSLLAMTPKAQATKGGEKTDELDFIKIENFCASNETIKKVKKKYMEKIQRMRKYLQIIYLIKE